MLNFVEFKEIKNLKAMGKGLESGQTLDSGRYRYVIEKVLGQGGFGITYLASTIVKVGNVSLKVKFAIKEHFIASDCEREAGTSKVVYSTPAKDRVENSRKDFISEARRLQAAGSGHPSIVKVNEIFEANNTAYYVMEYLEGVSLREYTGKRGKLSEKEMKELMIPVIDAVGTLHRNKMTHLDIKPDNVMVTKDDDGNVRPVLIDFGLSKHYNNDGTPTSTINILGCSDGYSPTEQYLGITTFSPEADVYAIGATMYYCLTGKTPKKASELRDGELAKDVEELVSSQTREAIKRATRPSKFDREKDVTSLYRSDYETNDHGHSHDEGTSGSIKKEETPSHEDNDETKVIGGNGGGDSGKGSNGWKLAVLAAVLVIVGLGVWFLADGKAEEEAEETTTVMEVSDMDWDSPLGLSKYTGEVGTVIVKDSINTIPHGRGVATIIDGEYAGNVYEGDFEWGKMQGKTVYQNNNGDKFEGTFKDNKYESGRYTIGSTGEYFEGSFKNGQPDKGNWYDKNGNKL